ncbi:MAG: tripartite tricarboxylate transporter substrate binding protein [Comamonadaceae bacterium]|nr:tripartite tricarboxylate transporter substrate binding protein [Comamonadaceae bacterium]
MKIRTLLAGAGLLISSGLAFAQSYPNKPIHFVTGFAAGSSIENLSRMVLDDISKRTGAVFVVEQRPGALGMIGMNLVAKAPPDGYTLMPTSSATHSSAPQLTKMATADPVKDFTHLGALDRFHLMLVVNAGSGIKTVEELVAEARKKSLNYGYGSATGQVGASAFVRAAGIDKNVVGVPYKSQPLALTDLVGNQVQFVTSDLPSVDALVRGNKLTALAVTGDKRATLFPDVPTLAERGINAELIGWVGVAGPAGLSEEVRTWWQRNLTTTLNKPNIIEDFKARGVEPYILFGPALEKFVADQYQVWGRHIREAGIKPE